MESELTPKTKKVEILLIFLAFILAVSLRFIKLGTLPLGENAANLALQALNLTRGTETVIGGQPVYVALTSMVFSVFSASGFWTLFWPAIFGSAIVFLPLLFRKWLGNNCSLILAFLLAFDPGLVAISRTASGSMIALVSLLAAFGFLLNKRPLLAGNFAGLAALSGAAFWPGLIALGIVLLVSRFSLPNGDQWTTHFHEIKWQPFVSALAVTVGLLGTCFLIHPSVISGIGSGFSDYLGSFSFNAVSSLSTALIGLLFSEIFTLPLAMWGLAIGVRENDRTAELMGYGFILSLILLITNPSQQLANLIWMIIPMAVLAARGGNDLLNRFSKQEWVVSTIQASLTIMLLVFSFLNLLSIAAYVPTDWASIRNAILEITLPIAFLIVVTILLAWGWSKKAAKQGLVAGISALLIFVTFGTAWKAAGLGPRPEIEIWQADPLPVGCEMVTKTASQLSLMTNGQPNRIDIALWNIDSDALRWCLRDFEKVSEKLIMGETETPSIVLSATDEEIGSTASYRGQDIHWTTSPDYDNMTAFNWLEWFALRKAPEKSEGYLLWARNDLFIGSISN
jgi:hypothetical protein